MMPLYLFTIGGILIGSVVILVIGYLLDKEMADSYYYEYYKEEEQPK